MHYYHPRPHAPRTHLVRCPECGRRHAVDQSSYGDPEGNVCDACYEAAALAEQPERRESVTAQKWGAA